MIKTISYKKRTVAETIIIFLRRLTSIQAVGLIVALCGLYFTINEFYSRRPRLTILPQALLLSDRFCRYADVKHNTYEIKYSPTLSAEFRFINRSTRPITITDYSVITEIIADTNTLYSRPLLPKNSSDEFVIEASRSVVRTFNMRFDPWLTFYDAKNYQRLLRTAVITSNANLFAVFRDLHFKFYSDKNKYFEINNDSDLLASRFHCHRRRIGNISQLEFIFGEDYLSRKHYSIINEPLFMAAELPNYGPQTGVTVNVNGLVRLHPPWRSTDTSSIPLLIMSVDEL